MSCKLIRQVVAEKIDENEKAIERLVELNRQLRRELAGLDDPSLPLADEGKVSDDGSPYAFLGPQEAVLQFLQDNPRSHTTARVRSAVIAGGMKTKSKNPHAVVYTALKRLAKRGSAKKMPGGRWKAIPSSS